MRVLSSLLCIICVPRVRSRCSWTSKNPYWTGGPRVDQVTLTSVNVSWAGLLENAYCADRLTVKYWWINKPNDWKTTEKLSPSATSYKIDKLHKYQEYVFVAVAIEDKTAFRSVDWNRSPATHFSTSDNPEVN